MKLFDFVLLIVSKKKLIIISTLFTFVLAILFSLSLTLFYKSDMTFLPPESKSGLDIMSIMNASGIGGGNDVLGSYYPVIPEHVNMILESRDIRIDLINKFELIKSYKLKKSKRPIKDALKILSKQIEIELVENSGLGFSNAIGYNLSIVDTSAQRSYDMLNFYFNEVQKKITSMSVEKAKNTIKFINGQLTKNEKEKEIAKQKLLQFQFEHKILDVPTQTKKTIELYAELKSALMMKELQLEYRKDNYKKNARQNTLLRNQIKVIQRRLKDVEGNMSPDYIVGLDVAPKLALEFLELRKELEILAKINLLLVQQNEIAKIQEANSSRLLFVVDPPVIPEYKYKPKRAFVVLAITFIEFFFMIIILCFSRFYSVVLKENGDFQRIVTVFKNKH